MSDAGVMNDEAVVRRRSLFWKVMPPLVAWALGRVVLGIIANSAGANPLDLRIWVHGDSGLYLQIATQGYSLSVSDGSKYPKGMWLGNAGWMPLYPWMIRGVMGAGMSPVAAGVLIAAAFHYLTLWLIWNRFLGDVSNGRGFLCLMLAALFPNFFFQHAVFPISLLTFAVLICVDRLANGRPMVAGVAGAGAALAYTTGVLLAPIAAAYFVLVPGTERKKIGWGKQLIACALPLAGLATVFVVHQIVLGKWNAFFLIQAKYEHGLSNPFATLWWQLSFLSDPDYRLKLDATQIALVAAIVVACVALTAVSWRKRTGVERLLALYALAFWLFPLMMGRGEYADRPAACLLPMVPLLRRWPVWVKVVLLGIFIGLATVTGRLFFQNHLW